MAADSDAEEVVQVTRIGNAAGCTHAPAPESATAHWRERAVALSPPPGSRGGGVEGRGGSGSARARYGASANQEDNPQRRELDIVSLCARAIAALVMLTLTSLITAVFVLMVMRELTPLSLN